MAHKQTPEDFRVIGASKGSIIVTLIATYSIAKTTSMIIMEVLKLADRFLELQKKAEEVRSLKLQNDGAEKAIKAIDDLAQSVRADGTTQIAKAVTRDIGLKQKEHNEQMTALQNSVVKMADFVTKGGHVDFVLTEEKAEPDDANADKTRAERVELRRRVEEIRQLEQRVKQIEHYGDPEPDGG